MINPYATSYIIAARLDRSLLRQWAVGDTLVPRGRKWDAPLHWREPSDADTA